MAKIATEAEIAEEKRHNKELEKTARGEGLVDDVKDGIKKIVRKLPNLEDEGKKF